MEPVPSRGTMGDIAANTKMQRAPRSGNLENSYSHVCEFEYFPILNRYPDIITGGRNECDDLVLIIKCISLVKGLCG